MRLLSSVLAPACRCQATREKINHTVSVQIFGVKNSPATRAAERFFKERRATIHMVDLKKKAIAAGEIKRFVERFGWAGLLDTEGKPYIEGGLKYLKLSEPELMGRIEREPALLRLPLVRGGKLFSIGRDEECWKAMLAASAV
jgi:arsenate reductase